VEEARRLFHSDHVGWTRRRNAFLCRVAPDDASWRPLVASGARTANHVASSMDAAWSALMADALGWWGREPGQKLATLWVLLLPSLALHVPTRPPSAKAAAQLSLAERAAALLNGDFVAALSDRNAGVWRVGARPARRAGGARVSTPTVAQRRAVTTATTPAQRRALRQASSGRLSAAARTLMSEPLAPNTMEVWRKALSLFPRATPDLATPESVAAAFQEELKEAAAFGERLKAPPKVTREGVAAAIRGAGRGKAPGLSGLRVEHLWALDARGRDSLVGVVSLLAGEGSARLPACAAAAHAGTSFLLLRKPGGVGADGLPGLRPIGVPKTLRKLAASALATAVRAPAAALFAPLQLGVGVSSPCERILHQVRAHMAAHHGHAVVQLDYRNAFNLVSRSAAAAVLGAALPVLSPYLQSVCGGDTGGAAPNVYGWDEAAGDDTAADCGAAAAVACAGAAGIGGDGGAAVFQSEVGRRGGGPGTAASGASATHGGGDRGGWGGAASGGAPIPELPPLRLFLVAERGSHQGDPLGPLLHAAALWLVLRRLSALHPDLLVLANHNDVVVVGAPEKMGAVLADAARLGRAVDAELAPAKCVG